MQPQVNKDILEGALDECIGTLQAAVERLYNPNHFYSLDDLLFDDSNDSVSKAVSRLALTWL